ncbi:WD-40 repeat-containing protein MSI4 [Linum perenne]
MEAQVPKKRGRKPKSKEEKDHHQQQQQQSKMKEGKRGHHAASVDEKYTQWKSLVPVLYDWLANHNLVWPSLSCRWGPQLEQATYKNRQRLYLSEQTDGSVPNTLVIANCEVVKPRVAAAEHISQFNEEARSPFVKKYKTIIHPGEVNRIRELPQNSRIVATHTDSPDVLIWDVETQPNRHAVLGATNSRPDLILTGHQDNAEFALAMCPTEPYVLSGGKDKSVVLWSIQDHITPSASDPASGKSPGSGGSIIKRSDWCPDKASAFGSSAEDGLLNIWDYDVVGIGKETEVKAPGAPAGLFFQHAGHRDKVVDFHWNTHDPWTIVSVSDDCETSGGGGTLQIWRMSDLLYRPEEEVLEELQNFKTHVSQCTAKT